MKIHPLLLCITMHAWTTAYIAAQEPDDTFAVLDDELKFRLGADGQFQIWPDPAKGDASNPSFGDVFSPQSFMQNSGFPGYLLIVGIGANDLTSQTDATWLLDCVGRGDDAALFAAIQAETEPLDRARERLRMLAIRAVQQRKLTAATPLLERLVANESADILARRAARETLATLSGEVLPPAPISELEPIADVLRGLEIVPDVVVVIDQYKLPSSQIFASIGRDLGKSVTRRSIVEAGGSVSLSQWAGAVSLASLPSIMGYEWSRMLGNLRVDRMVFVADYLEESPGNPNAEVVIDGVFDVESIESVMRDLLADELGVTIELKDGVLTASSQMGVSWRIDARRMIGSARIVPAESPSAVEVDALIASLGSDAPIRVRCGDALDLELPEQIRQFTDFKRVDLWIPQTTTQPLRAVVEYREENSAKLLLVLARALPRTLSSALDRANIDDPAVDTLAENVDEMEVERDGKTLRATLPLAGIDIAAMMRALAEQM